MSMRIIPFSSQFSFDMLRNVLQVSTIIRVHLKFELYNLIYYKKIKKIYVINILKRKPFSEK